MMQSILDDIRQAFRSGNMVIRLIIINIAIYIFLAIANAFTGGAIDNFLSWIAVPSDGWTLLTRPWTLLMNMFVHIGLWHVAMNMLYLYWFGRIVGDLIGDRHILPIYIYGGLAGGLFYVLCGNVFPMLGISGIGTMAYGASAAVAALVVVSGMISPDYKVNLMFIGPISLKYIVAFIISFYVLGALGGDNRGGNIGHLGGVLLGILYYSQLKNGRDWSLRFNAFLESIRLQPKSSKKQVKKSKKQSAPMKVIYKAQKEMTVDGILDRIKKVGYDGLTDKEKDFLDKASKQ